MEVSSKGRSPAAPVNDLVGCHHGFGRYEKRKHDASVITKTVIDRPGGIAHHCAMFTKSELLTRVLGLAKSKVEVATVLGLSPPRISEMLKGTRDISFDEARTLINHYGLEREASVPAPVSMADIAAENGIALIEEVDLVLGMGGGTFSDMAESKGLVPFKDDWLRGLHSGPTSALRVVRGEGDSMQPTILDGDIVLVDTSQRNILSQDRIWAVFWGELGMIKRVRRTPRDGFMLMSDNQAIAPIEAVDGEMSVMGRVIWIGRRM